MISNLDSDRDKSSYFLATFFEKSVVFAKLSIGCIEFE